MERDPVVSIFRRIAVFVRDGLNFFGANFSMLGQIFELHQTALLLEDVNDLLGDSASVEAVFALGGHLAESSRKVGHAHEFAVTGCSLASGKHHFVSVGRSRLDLGLASYPSTRRDFVHGIASICQSDGWSENLIERQFARSKFVDSIDPRGRRARHSDRVYAVQTDGLGHAQLLERVERHGGGRSTTAIEASHLPLLVVPVEAEDVATDARTAWLSHVECGRDGNSSFGSITALFQDTDAGRRGQWLRGSHNTASAHHCRPARIEGRHAEWILRGMWCGHLHLLAC